MRFSSNGKRARSTYERTKKLFVTKDVIPVGTRYVQVNYGPSIKYEHFKNDSDEKNRCKELENTYKLFTWFDQAYAYEVMPKYKDFTILD